MSALLRERESRTNDERRRRTPRNAILLRRDAHLRPTTDGRKGAGTPRRRSEHDRACSGGRATPERLANGSRHAIVPAFRISRRSSRSPPRRASRAKNPPGFSSLATCAASDARERFSGGAVDVPLVTQNDTAHVEAAWRWRGGFAKRGRGQRRQRGSGRWIRESARHLPETLNDKRPPRHGNGRLGPRARSAGPRARVESVSVTRTEWIRRP